jgi:hypothetical protein
MWSRGAKNSADERDGVFLHLTVIDLIICITDVNVIHVNLINCIKI